MVCGVIVGECEVVVVCECCGVGVCGGCGDYWVVGG